MRKIFYILLSVLAVSAPLPAYADEVEKLVFLVIEDDEVIASNTRLGRFDRLKLSAKEKIIETGAANAVAVVVTNQRYAAYGVFTGQWNSQRRQAGEKFESMDMADFSAVLLTSDRILTFYGRTGGWQQTRR